MSHSVPNSFSDNIRSEAHFAWVGLLLSSVAMGLLIIWALSNQQMLLPSLIVPENSVSPLSPLPKRLKTLTPEGGQALATASVEASTTPSSTSSLTSSVAPVSSVEDTVQGELTTSIAASALPGVTQSQEKAVVVTDRVQAEVAQTDAVQAERTRRELPPFIWPYEDSSDAQAAVSDQPQTLDESDQLMPGEVVSKVTEDNALLAQLTEAARAGLRPEVQAQVRPETGFEAMRREELAQLTTLSNELQIDTEAAELDARAASSLYEIFELLFLYSETAVSVTVASNDTSSVIRNIALAQRRGEQIVDSLALSGLSRSRFTIIAEPSAELALGSHRIAIQATLDP